MRALHIVTAFPRHDDDLITPWLGQVLIGLRHAGVDVSVLAPAYRGGGATEWRGISVRRFRYAPGLFETLTHDETAPDRLRHRPWYAALLPGYLLGGLVAAARMGLEAPDIIHVHWPMPHALFAAVAQASSGGHSAIVSSYYSVELKWIERRLPWLVPFLRWTIESADEVTAISTATGRAVQRYAERSVRIIPFAAGLSGDATRPAREAGGAPPVLAAGAELSLDRALPAPDTAREVLFVGRLVERKGVEVLVRAVALLRERRDIRLRIVGQGAWRPRIEQAIRVCGIQDAVKLMGRVDDEELRRVYDDSDLFVLPAIVDAKGDTEGLGVVLIEALRAGLPVIASDAGGIPDIVVGGETGWLVPPNDVGALARAIDEVLDDPAEAKRRVVLGQERVDERFTLPGIVEGLVECYTAAVAARSRRT